MNRNLKRFLIIIAFIVMCFILAFVVNITSMPDNIILFEGERLNIKTAPGVVIEARKVTNPNLENIENYKTVQASTSLQKEKDYTGNIELTASLFGKFDVKDITVNIIENAEVVPLGNIVGVKLYTNGVLVVGLSEISGEDKKIYKPYEEAGIEEGDMIVEMNQEAVTCTADLINKVNQSSGQEIEVKYIRNKEIIETTILPVKTDTEKYKLGLWVRDTAAGVGTISFYEPSSKKFAALGHGIMDVDTEKLIDISTGEFVTTNIISIVKGEKGNPGKIQGSIEKQETIGNITDNTVFGVFGQLENTQSLNINLSNKMPVALRDEIKTGKAKIICTLENNVRKEYEIEIQKIFKNNNSDNKSMVLKITDEELLEKTGGIIQGMSGSPIIQDGKVIGALTHVLVSDPTMGYGVFADMMIKQMRETE